MSPAAHESQHVEWKESWRDEYLKWLCGFANAHGGTLTIGKNDRGEVVGIDNRRQLLEEIPNKVRDLLGILVDVHSRSEGAREYLDIVVDAYPYPISYKGQYHYRSGSTKQELKGATLDQFLLRKQGKHWDGVPVPGVAAAALESAAFALFRQRAARSGRVDADVLHDSNEALLDNLHLTDGEYLKRAAVLLFHPTPEKFVTGAYVKIGYFASDEDLRYQDEVHGPLMLQVDRTLELLQTKYLTAQIRYEGAARVEERPFPEAALREALLNTLAHKDYSGGTPVQISVYENRLLFWNEGHLPEHWTVEHLQRKHPSRPFNPDLANTLFRAGYIESWGRGTLKMMAECRAHHLPAPRYSFDAAGFAVEFCYYTAAYLQSQGLRAEFIPLVLHAQDRGALTNTTVQQLAKVSKPTASRYLAELEKAGYLQKSGTTGVGTEYTLKGS
ncbi:ATP-binding protein [Hymenobacter terricola]|uniref:ATP-binding protein n=1 Tax=Hymenobacter terricola TaxID=2819236 RepID=UPI001B30C0A5|nr:ATP-binding protein [Hymenobacter terricola]